MLSLFKIFRACTESDATEDIHHKERRAKIFECLLNKNIPLKITEIICEYETDIIFSEAISPNDVILKISKTQIAISFKSEIKIIDIEMRRETV